MLMVWIVAAATMRACSSLLLVPFLTAIFDNPTTAFPWLAAIFFTVCVGWLAERQLATSSFDLGLSSMTALNDRLIDILLCVPLGWLTGQKQAEAKRALSETGMAIFAACINLAAQIGINIVLPGLIGVGLLFISWPLGIAALVCWPILLFAMTIGARLMRRAEADFAIANRNASERIDEFAAMQMVLRSSGRAGIFGPVAEAINAQQRATTRILWFSLPGTLIFSIAFQLVLILLFSVLGWLLWTENVTTVLAIGLGIVVLRFMEPIAALIELFPALENLHGMAERTADILQAPVLASSKNNETPSRYDVELQDVSLSIGDQRILHGVSFKAPAGKTTALVGPSGAGKSTILSLLARFHEPQGGLITIGGVDLRNIDPQAHIEALAMVFQNVQLLDDTIAGNIAIARPEASDADIRTAGRLSGVAEIADRLGGWDSFVGDSGQMLSGGERQRISIARALLKKTPILLLDEATSALDTINEAAINKVLSGFSGRTIIMVAHRIETILNADHIVFVEDGRVVEAGDLQSLIQSNNKFAQWWRRRRAAPAWQIKASAYAGSSIA